MKAQVKEKGLLIPKRLLKGVKEVEILKGKGRMIVLPVPSPNDPLFKLGKRPIKTGLADASEHHDVYLYDPPV